MKKIFSTQKFRIILILLTLVLVAAACNRAQAPVQPDQSQRQTQNQQESSSNNQQPSGQTPVTGKITVQQTVAGSNLNRPNYQVTEGQSALDLLKATHQVQTKTYSGVGEFVEAIDGIKPDGKRFWAFYVNDKSSNVGASSYVLKNGDKIEWKLETIK